MEATTATATAEALLSPGSASRRRRTEQWRMFPPLMAFFAGYMIMRNAVAVWVLAVVCRNEGSWPNNCDSANVSAVASTHLMWIGFAMSLPTVFVSAALTAASDIVGRRPVLMFSLGAMFVSAMGCTCCAWLSAPLWVMIPVFALAGLGGSFGTILAVAFAYTADCCPTAKARGRAFSMLESSIFIAGIAAPTIGGYLEDIHPALAFAVVALCYGSAVGLAGWCDEPVPRRSRPFGGRMPWGRVTKLSLLLGTYDRTEGQPRGGATEGGRGDGDGGRGCSGEGGGGPGDRRAAGVPAADGKAAARAEASPAWLVLLVFVLTFCPREGVVVLLPLYSKLKPFEFDAMQLGYVSSLSSACKWTSLALVMPLWLSCNPEGTRGLVIAVRVGALIGVLGCVAFGLAKSRAGLYAATVVESYAQVITASLRALLSCLSGPEGQGRMLGRLAVVETVCALLNPMAVNALWIHTVRWRPPLAYAALAGVAALGFAASLCLRGSRRPASS